MIPEAAVSHYKQMQGLQGLVVMAASELWSDVGLSDLTGSWSRHVPAMASVLSSAQAKAAAAGASYGAATLANQGLYEAPEHFVDTSAFAGVASDGRSIAELLYSPVPYTKSLIAGGMDPGQALKSGGNMLTTITRTQVADAGRGAAGVDIATRKNVGYVRMLNPPSCSRCSLLAGRFYRWNAGFDRHPRCDCLHVETTMKHAAEAEGLVHDPYEYFKSLPASEQDKVYGKAQAQAVRDGADIFQVVNAKRGVKPGGLVTTTGTSRRGNFGADRGPRLTPEAIYDKGLSREKTLAELERYGYILPGGQNPLGALRGQTEGFGQMGRGGTRVGARDAVLNARASGVRDPKVRATMTAAERRDYDAQANWDAVRAGRNPFTNAKNAKVTPEVAARAEKEYRKLLDAPKSAARAFAFKPQPVDRLERWRAGRDVDVYAGARPAFNPENPLEFYGRAVDIADDSEVARIHLTDLEMFDEKAHVTLREHFASKPGGGFYVGDKAMPELDNQGHLAGQRPRGWAEGQTWDNVPGGYSPSQKVCACGGGGKGHGATSLALHEASHALDHALAKQIGVRASASTEWRAAFYAMHGSARMNPYFTYDGNADGFLSEGFAESYAAFTKYRLSDPENLDLRIAQALDADRRDKPTMDAARGILAYFEKIEREAMG